VYNKTTHQLKYIDLKRMLHNTSESVLYMCHSDKLLIIDDYEEIEAIIDKNLTIPPEERESGLNFCIIGTSGTGEYYLFLL